jgi:ABC-type dipeptide/oligopeptide/nickel transport system permease component
MQQLGVAPTSTGGIAAVRGSLLGGTLSEEQYKAVLAYLQAFLPHGNPLIGAAQYIYNVFRGNWGISLMYIQPVNTLIASALPWTIFIVATANILNF